MRQLFMKARLQPKIYMSYTSDNLFHELFTSTNASQWHKWLDFCVAFIRRIAKQRTASKWFSPFSESVPVCSRTKLGFINIKRVRSQGIWETSWVETQQTAQYVHVGRNFLHQAAATCVHSTYITVGVTRTGINFACALCDMAHTLQKCRIEIFTSRHYGAHVYLMS